MPPVGINGGKPVVNGTGSQWFSSGGWLVWSRKDGSGLQVYGKKRSNALKVKEIRGEKPKGASWKPKVGKRHKAAPTSRGNEESQKVKIVPGNWQPATGNKNALDFHLLNQPACRQKQAGCHVQQTRNGKKSTFVLLIIACRQENWFTYYCIFCAPLWS